MIIPASRRKKNDSPGPEDAVAAADVAVIDSVFVKYEEYAELVAFSDVGGE